MESKRFFFVAHFLFSPEDWGEDEPHFDLRIFFRWVGSTNHQPGKSNANGKFRVAEFTFT